MNSDNKFDIGDKCFCVERSQEYSHLNGRYEEKLEINEYRILHLYFKNGWFYKVTDNFTVCEEMLHKTYKSAQKEFDELRNSLF